MFYKLVFYGSAPGILLVLGRLLKLVFVRCDHLFDAVISIWSDNMCLKDRCRVFFVKIDSKLFSLDRKRVVRLFNKSINIRSYSTLHSMATDSMPT